MLYKTVQAHWKTFLAELEAAAEPPPQTELPFVDGGFGADPPAASGFEPDPPAHDDFGA